MTRAPPPSPELEPDGRDPPPAPPRFDRLARLIGEEALARLAAARVIVIGLGGVGGHAAEALCRSAVGHLMLVDHDEVCVTNTNRQVQALADTVGESKALLLRDRLRRINPDAAIEAAEQFFDPTTSAALLRSPWGPTPAYDFVVDCIDNLKAKAHLLVTCRDRGQPVVSAMGAAGKLDPTAVRVADLGDTDICPMAQQLRKALRQKHGLPKGRGKLGVTAVFSAEPRRWPRRLGGELDGPRRCTCASRHPQRATDSKAMVDGTAGFVTAAFGLACAAHVVTALIGELPDRAPPAAPPPRRVRRPPPGA